MKIPLKQAALLVSFLAWLQLILGGLVRAGWLEGSQFQGLLQEAFLRIVLTPDPTFMLLVLLGALGLWVVLSFLERRKPQSSLITAAQSPAASRPTRSKFPPRGSLRKTQGVHPGGSQETAQAVPQKLVNIEKEWHNLEEAEKEAIRAIASQDGLWETDILAALEARGFIQVKATLDSLTERVSFVQCDHAGYHSVSPEYRTQLTRVMAHEQGDEIV